MTLVLSEGSILSGYNGLEVHFASAHRLEEVFPAFDAT